jgi:hypothetical protein
MPYRPRDIESVLLNKFDFSRAEGHSSDHRWFEIRLPGLPCILTKVSQGRRETTRGLESKIARQLRVRRTFFRGMMDCTNEREDYYQQVQEDPYPPFNIRF